MCRPAPNNDSRGWRLAATDDEGKGDRTIYPDPRAPPEEESRGPPISRRESAATKACRAWHAPPRTRQSGGAARREMFSGGMVRLPTGSHERLGEREPSTVLTRWCRDPSVAPWHILARPGSAAATLACRSRPISQRPSRRFMWRGVCCSTRPWFGSVDGETWWWPGAPSWQPHAAGPGRPAGRVAHRFRAATPTAILVAVPRIAASRSRPSAPPSGRARPTAVDGSLGPGARSLPRPAPLRPAPLRPAPPTCTCPP